MERIIMFSRPIQIIILALGFFSSCSKEMTPPEEDNGLPLTTKACYHEQDCVYNSSAKVWMIKQEDPYAIAKIQAISREQFVDATISPTHHALKIYPRNEQELNEIINRPDITVSYIPFGYQYLPAEIAEKLDTSSVDSGSVYFEEERYYSEIGESEMRPLPVLYVAWNVATPLPAQYDYSIEYEACLPDASNSDNSSLGVAIANNVRGSSNRTISGFVLDYDDLLEKYVVVKNLRIRVSYGLSSIETYTNHAGHFSITGNINDDATVSIVYENDKWRLTNNSLFTYVVSLGTVMEKWGATGTTKVIRTDTEAQSLHRAAEFFYNGMHDIETPQSSYSLRINMVNYLANDVNGIFHGNVFFSSYISIKLASYYNDPMLMSHLLHELGHFNHFQTGGSLEFLNAPSLFRESYADFVAWYLLPEYYAIVNNGIYDSSWDFYMPRDNQGWTINTGNNYSPLYIDLVDDYNQSTSNSSYHNDAITGFTYGMIPEIAAYNSNWNDLKNCLQDYIGVLYSLGDYNAFIAPYNDYFAN